MSDNTRLRILFVGNTKWPMYVNAFYNATKDMLDVDADIFDERLVSRLNENNPILRFEGKYLIGPHIIDLNRRLLKYIYEHIFDAVFFYNTRCISYKTIKKIHDRGIITAVYCNDNPFTNNFGKYFWRNVRESVKYADITYSYRLNNIEQYKDIGAKDVRLLRSYYNEDRSFKMDEADYDTELYVPKVIFLGHYEDDERLEYLRALAEVGVELGVINESQWEAFAAEYDNVYVFEETFVHYNEIINRALIAIVFLSKINNDTYTRRCFEIPPTGTMMIAPYNEDLVSLFDEDREVAFYRDKEDFVKKIQYYLDKSDEAMLIGEKGRQRVLKDGNGARDRVEGIARDIEEIKNFRNG